MLSMASRESALVLCRAYSCWSHYDRDALTLVGQRKRTSTTKIQQQHSRILVLTTVCLIGISSSNPSATRRKWASVVCLAVASTVSVNLQGVPSPSSDCASYCVQQETEERDDELRSKRIKESILRRCINIVLWLAWVCIIDWAVTPAHRPCEHG